MTMPDESGSNMAAAIRCNSDERPVNGHVNFTSTA